LAVLLPNLGGGLNLADRCCIVRT